MSETNVLSRVGAGITKARNFVVNTIFIVIAIFVVVAVVASCEGANVPKNSALIIDPRGVLVEELRVPNPLQSLVSPASVTAESSLHDVLRAIELATDDDDIRMIVLDLDNLLGASPAQAQAIGAKLRAFQAAGKKVAAYGYFFSQGQYHLASFADELYMHPMGQVLLPGFGFDTLYFKGLFEKFGVNVHVFRVGEYKEAVEPFTRADMSEEARLANETLYQNLWQNVVTDIAENRSLEREFVLEYANDISAKLDAAHGDLARAAIENHLVDELMTADQARIRFGDHVGLSRGDINGIRYQSYLAARGPVLNPGADKIAVIVVEGAIFSGGQVAGVASSESIIELIRQAKQSSAVKGVVLRVDSPGGSAFASELIRQELELLQLAGKPVVASFATVAASGGYWAAATADSIVAEPTSITGSIGIFSVLTTFEDSLEQVGVTSDGVGTTPLGSGFGSLTGMSDTMANLLQAGVEHGYRQFTNLVARGRNLSPEQVDQIAQGRVWTGEVAMELGLIDELGNLERAAEKAAELAKLETWTVEHLRRPIDARDALIAELLQSQTPPVTTNPLVRRFTEMTNFLTRFHDPSHAFAICFSCLSF